MDYYSGIILRTAVHNFLLNDFNANVCDTTQLENQLYGDMND